MSSVASPFVLPNGVVVKNRIVKAAMSEYLGDDRTNDVNERLIRLYARWASTEAGMLITGNLMVSRRYMEAPTNVCVDSATDDAMLRRVAAAVGERSLLVGQLSHSGRQTPIAVSRQCVAPSRVAIDVFPTAFVTPTPLTHEQIAEVVAQFADAAERLHAAGFAGVQLHAAHGYLLSSFLSRRTNRRDDEYGGLLERRARLLYEVVAEIRRRVPARRFVLSVKLNSSDFQLGGFDENDALAVCLELERRGVDFVELSGGSYEATRFLEHGDEDEAAAATASSTTRREAFFIEFATRIRGALRAMPIMLTGGFRSVPAMNAALRDGVDLIGLARPFAFESVDVMRQVALGTLQRRLRSPSTAIVAKDSVLRALNSGVEAVWYAKQIHRMADGGESDAAMSRVACLFNVVPKYYLHPRLLRHLTAAAVFAVIARVAWVSAS